MEFDVETLREVQVYAYVIVTGVLSVIFYLYIYHLYSSDKNGTSDYEKNSHIALDDSLDSVPLSGIVNKDKKNGVNK